MNRLALWLLLLAASVVHAQQPNAPVYIATGHVGLLLPYACSGSPPSCPHVTTVTSPPASAFWTVPTTNTDGSTISPAQLPLTSNVYSCYSPDGTGLDCTPALTAYKLQFPFAFLDSVWHNGTNLMCVWVTALDNEGHESALSAEMCVLI